LAKSGFTLVEVIITTMIVAIAVTGVFGGIRALTAADVKARDADLLQRLASEKVEDIRVNGDPNTYGTNGDFTDRGYPDVSWTMEIQTVSTANVDQLTVTAARAKESQAITEFVYVPPATTTTTQTP
jgi:prepilin-type N-terminal cleavage/methylation domain-containing protein